MGTYPITILIVSDMLMPHGLLIGTNFLDNVELNIKEGNISITKLQHNTEENKLPEIYKIDCVREADLSHNTNAEHRANVRDLINNYNPNSNKRELDFKMNIVLKDSEPVFQTARRLSPFERGEVNAHVEEWLREGII